MTVHPPISSAMHLGQRVEVLLNRGEADVWYRGTVLPGGRVLLDDGFPYAPPPGRQVAESDEIAEWRQLGQSSA